VGLEAARLNPFVSGPALRGVRTPSRTLAGHCAGRRYRTRPWAPPAGLGERSEWVAAVGLWWRKGVARACDSPGRRTRARLVRQPARGL